MSTGKTTGGALRRQAPLELLSRNLGVGICRGRNLISTVHIAVYQSLGSLYNTLDEPTKQHLLIACAPNAQITPAIQQHVSPPLQSLESGIPSGSGHCYASDGEDRTNWLSSEEQAALRFICAALGGSESEGEGLRERERPHNCELSSSLTQLLFSIDSSVTEYIVTYRKCVGRRRRRNK